MVRLELEIILYRHSVRPRRVHKDIARLTFFHIVNKIRYMISRQGYAAFATAPTAFHCLPFGIHNLSFANSLNRRFAGTLAGGETEKRR
jgi:hypothetical protein